MSSSPPGGAGAEVQGTVAGFEPATRAGVAVLDDGTSITFTGTAFDRSGLRFLRPGQRIRLRISPAGDRVEFVTLVTLPDPD